MKYNICCKESGHPYQSFDNEKEAKAKAHRYCVQRLTCEKCGSRDWVVVESEEGVTA